MKRKVLLLIGVLSFLMSTHTYAIDVYLASTAQGGSAGNTGNSFGSPKETIAYLNGLANNNITSTAGLHLYIKGSASYTWNPPGTIGIDDDFLIKGGFDPASTGTYATSTNNPVLYPTLFTLTSTPGGANGVFGLPSAAINGFTLDGLQFVGPAYNNYLVRNTFSGGTDTYYFKNCSFKKFGSPIWTQGNKAIYVENCYFEDNLFTAGAGAISMMNGGAELVVNNSSFISNTGSTGGGGAITSTGKVTVTNSVFCNNKNVAPSVGGGGAYGDVNANQTNKVTFTGCTFNGNNANAIGGGAIAKLGGVVEITNCLFYNNFSTPGGGAVLIALNTTGSFITGSKFYKNYSIGGGTLPGGNLGGGAVHIRPGGAPTTISTCVFDGNYIQNSGGFGGAVFLDNYYGGNVGHLNLDNCTFVNNLNGISSTPTALGSDIGLTHGDYGSAKTDIVVTNSKMQLASPGTGVYRAYGLNNTSPYHYTFSGTGNTFSNTTGSLGSPTYNCPTAINAVAVNVTGQVWDDVNGNVVFDGSENGTNAGGPLYVNLVDGTGTVVASTTVSSTGSYTLSAPTYTTGLKLVLASTATSSTPGSLPSQWVNTGENVGAGNTATQSATLGQIELSTGTTAITAQNFGIEHLPTPGSGTATVSNAGGTTPVTVPPSAFTSTSAANDNGDTPPGSVTAIKITVFPSNVTSLTINGTVYTAGSFPVTGVVVPTDGNGAPNVPILVDPTNDSQPVSFTYTAIDNAGKESTTTGTAVLTFTPVPDLTPIIYARPSSVYRTTPMTVVVDVVEILNVASSGLITVKVTRDSKLSLSLDPLASVVDGRSVQNGVWSLDSSDPSYYVLTTSQSVGAYGSLSFGLSGRLTPGSTTGVLTVSAVIVGGSGGEVRVDNNADADKIDYFQQ